jgi:hypothetical protein
MGGANAGLTSGLVGASDYRERGSRRAPGEPIENPPIEGPPSALRDRVAEFLRVAGEIIRPQS